MTNFIIGIPTLNRYDFLIRCIESIWRNELKPSKVIVIDNGGSFHCEIANTYIYRPNKNIGVAASWNKLHSLSESTDLIICNDDIEFAVDSLAALMAVQADFVVANGQTGWSCFKQSHKLWDKIGNYDENFWPAYYEDNDYRYRLKMAGIPVTHANHHKIIHHGSKSINPEAKKLMSSNLNYYKAKWGGEPYFETFRQPFNKTKIIRGSGQYK